MSSSSQRPEVVLDKSGTALRAPRRRNTISISVSKVTVSIVLVREDKCTQYPLYYISKMLLDTENKYPHLEKLSLALIIIV